MRFMQTAKFCLSPYFILELQLWMTVFISFVSIHFETCQHLVYTMSQKQCAYFEMMYLKIIIIDFDDIWQKYSKYARIEFVWFGFRVGLLFFRVCTFF